MPIHRSQGQIHRTRVSVGAAMEGAPFTRKPNPRTKIRNHALDDDVSDQGTQFMRGKISGKSGGGPAGGAVVTTRS